VQKKLSNLTLHAEPYTLIKSGKYHLMVTDTTT